MSPLKFSLACMFSFIIATSSLPAFANDAPTAIANAGVTEHTGAKISTKLLTDYFQKDRPVILSVIDDEKNTQSYTKTLNDLDNSLSNLHFGRPEAFDVVVVSPGPLHTTLPWIFLTADTSTLNSLKTELGIGSAHPPGIYILTSDGKISRYLYGSEFHEKDLKFALIEASNHKFGSAFDRVLSYAFHFDSIRNSYTIDLWRIVTVVLLLQALIFGIFFTVFWKKKKIKT